MVAIATMDPDLERIRKAISDKFGDDVRAVTIRLETDALVTIRVEHIDHDNLMLQETYELLAFGLWSKQ